MASSPKLIFSDSAVPLVVDLDGTLIKTDLLYEGFIMLIRKNPVYIFKCLAWLLKGKVYLKNKIGGIIHLRYDLLPYNDDLISFLEKESANGRKLILATASLTSGAGEIAKVYPIFGEVYGTGEVNLKGVNKLKILNAELGESKFDYIGDSHADLAIFPSCRYSYLVDPSKSLERKTKKVLLRHRQSAEDPRAIRRRHPRLRDPEDGPG